MPDPTTCRPRIEGERESEIFAAVVALLVEAGYDKLTFDAVATAVRASKATLYRRWPTKADLVLDAVADQLAGPEPRAEDDDTGSPARRPARPGVRPGRPLRRLPRRARRPRPGDAPRRRAVRRVPRAVRPAQARPGARRIRARPRNGERSGADADLHLLANLLPAICVHDTFVFDIHATPERVAHVLDSVVLPAARATLGREPPHRPPPRPSPEPRDPERTGRHVHHHRPRRRRRPSQDPAAPAPRGLGLALAIIGGAQLMIVLDGTIVNIALPHIQTDLGFSNSSLSWVVNAYALALGSLLLLGGRLGDILGRRKMFILGVAVFAISSLLGGLAQNEAMMIGSRVLQGVGAALASPTALALITTTFPAGKERNRAMGVYAAMSGAGAAVGLILGGALTEVNWRWTFFINVPIGLLVAFLAPRFLTESERQTGRFDLPGAFTGTLGLVGIVYGLTHAAEPTSLARPGHPRLPRRRRRPARRLRRSSSAAPRTRCCRSGSWPTAPAASASSSCSSSAPACSRCSTSSASTSSRCSATRR